MVTDHYGLPLTTHLAAARDAYVTGVDHILAATYGASDAFSAAVALDPDFTLAHVGLARARMYDGDMPAAQETRYDLDMKEVQRQFWAHWESTGKPEFKKGVAQAFMRFTKRKYGQVKHGKK